MRNYVKLFSVPYLKESCPHAKGAKSILYSNVLNEIEDISPGTKLNLVKGFLKNKERFPEEKVELKECRICGMPSLGDICSFCRFWGLEKEIKMKR